jgi:hypothetical protein
MTVASMSEKQLWSEIFPDNISFSGNDTTDNIPSTIYSLTTKTNVYKCNCCDKSFTEKYISFPMISFKTRDVELCSKMCYDNYKSSLPEKIWGSIQLDNQSMVIPFHNKVDSFTLLMEDEISKLSKSEKDIYYEKEEEYCSLYPIKSSIHFQTDRDNKYIQSIEEEFNDILSPSSGDDY